MQSMERLALLQHFYHCLHTLLSGFELFCRLKAIQNRVQIGFIEGLEECASLLILAELFHKICGGSGLTKGIIGPFPATIRFRSVDFTQSKRSHRSGFNKSLRMIGVFLRPAATRASRRKFLQPRFGITRLLLTI